MVVSKYRGTPKSSILIGVSIINHPFWGTPILGNTHIMLYLFFITETAVFENEMMIQPVILPSIQAESYPDTFVSNRDCSPEVMQTKLCNKGHFLIATRNATCDNASTESGCLRKNITQDVNGYRPVLNLRALGILMVVWDKSDKSMMKSIINPWWIYDKSCPIVCWFLQTALKRRILMTDEFQTPRLWRMQLQGVRPVPGVSLNVVADGVRPCWW